LYILLKSHLLGYAKNAVIYDFGHNNVFLNGLAGAEKDMNLFENATSVQLCNFFFWVTIFFCVSWCTLQATHPMTESLGGMYAVQ
jgi:hypothetical protein